MQKGSMGAGGGMSSMKGKGMNGNRPGSGMKGAGAAGGMSNMKMKGTVGGTNKMRGAAMSGNASNMGGRNNAQMGNMRSGGNGMGMDDDWSSDYGSTNSLSSLAPNQRTSRSSSRQPKDLDPFGSVVDNYDDYYTDSTSSLKYLVPPTTKLIHRKKTMKSGSSAHSGVQSSSTFSGGPSGSRWDSDEILLHEVEPSVYAADSYGRTSRGRRARHPDDGYDRRGPRYESDAPRRGRGREPEYEYERDDRPRRRNSKYDDDNYDRSPRGSRYGDDRYEDDRYEDDRYDRPRGRDSGYENERYERSPRGSRYEDDSYDRPRGRGPQYDNYYEAPPDRGSGYEEDRYDERPRRRQRYEDEYDRPPRRGSTVGEFGGYERHRKRYAEDRNDRDFYEEDRFYDDEGRFGRNMKYVDRRR